MPDAPDSSQAPAAPLRAPRWPAPRRLAPRLLRLGLLGLAVAALLAVLVGRIATAQRLTHPPATTAHAAATAAVFGAPVGTAAPDFYLQVWSWAGSPNATPQTIHLAGLRGQPVVLNFWASWCEACREEAPTLEAAWQTYQASGVVVVGIAVEDNDPDSLAFLRQYGITYLNGPDVTETTTFKYGVTGLPATIFIDRIGRVVARHPGLIESAALESGIRAILAAGT
jgi:cytochrome c biogenesis protein CcmG/thiol:disulfide interchange protein DsbE